MQTARITFLTGLASLALLVVACGDSDAPAIDATTRDAMPPCAEIEDIGTVDNRIAYVADDQVLVVGVSAEGVASCPISIASVEPSSARVGWSPDGRWLHYVNDEELWIVGMTGLRPDAPWFVPNALVAGGYRIMEWSPDSSRMLYQGGRITGPGNGYDLYAIAVNDAGLGVPIRLNPGMDPSVRRAGWSPDSNRVWYATYSLDAGGDLLLVDLRSTPVVPASLSAALPGTLNVSLTSELTHFSSDSSLLMFKGSRGSPSQQLWVVDVSGPEPGPPQLLNAPEQSNQTGRFAPTMAAALYYDELDADRELHVASLDADATSMSSLIANGVSPAAYWSPTSEWIAFASPPEIGLARIVDRSVDSVHRTPADFVGPLLPGWAPDGSWFWFLSGAPDERQLFAVSASLPDSAPVRLHPAPLPFGGVQSTLSGDPLAVWSPDSASLAVSVDLRGTDREDIVITNLADGEPVFHVAIDTADKAQGALFNASWSRDSRWLALRRVEVLSGTVKPDELIIVDRTGSRARTIDEANAMRFAVWGPGPSAN